MPMQNWHKQLGTFKKYVKNERFVIGREWRNGGKESDFLTVYFTAGFCYKSDTNLRMIETKFNKFLTAGFTFTL